MKENILKCQYCGKLINTDIEPAYDVDGCDIVCEDCIPQIKEDGIEYCDCCGDYMYPETDPILYTDEYGTLCDDCYRKLIGGNK